MRNRTLTLCLALLAPTLVPLGPHVAIAQTASPEPGARVRVTSTALHLHHVEGVVSASSSDTLILFTPYSRMVRGRVVWDTTRRNVPLDAIDTLEVSTGTASNFGRGAGIGALILGSAGLVLGIAAGNEDPNHPSFFQYDQGTLMAMGLLEGTLVGGLLGGIIGAMSHHDVWKAATVPSATTPLTLRLGRAPHGGRTVGVGMTLRF